MGLIECDDGWRLPDWLWEKIEPLLPPPPPHPLGCHRPRIPDRRVMDAILLVLRTGMQWNALRATGICNSSSAHRRFQEWERAGVFHEIWREGLLDYDAAVGIDWSFLAADGAMAKAPLGGAQTGPNPTDRGKKGRNVRLSARRGGCRSDWHATARAATTSRSEPTLESIPSARPAPTTKPWAERPLRGWPGRHSPVDRQAAIEDPADSETGKDTSPSSPHDQQPDDRFDEFWELYPNKESKQPARLKWRRLSERQRALAIDVARQMHDLVAAGVQEAQFCPHPTTFMNQRRWEDWADGPPPRWRPSTTSMRGDDLRSLAAVARQMEDDHEDL